MAADLLTVPPAASRAASPPLPLASIRACLPRLEALAALLLCLLASGLHLALCLRGYPLWRDEANAVQLATLPSFAETWKYLPFDSIPLGFHGLLRAWCAVLPGTDGSLRFLGLLIGLGLLGACWLCVRTVGGGLPLLSLLFLGLNPLFIRYGDSLRAYGLGTLLALLTFAAVWRVVQDPRPGRVALAALVGVLSVNSLFYNAVLLLAVCLAGAGVALGERRWKKAAVLLALGLPAALSLLTYQTMFREQHRWGFLFAFSVTPRVVYEKTWDFLAASDPLVACAWVLAAVGLVGCGAWLLRRDRAAGFAAGVLVIGIVTYGTFLQVLHYYPQPWYFVALLGLATVCLDVLCHRLLLVLTAPRADLVRALRLVLIFALGVLTLGQTAQDLRLRPTNIDQVAAVVQRRAAPGDLIVHLRWECAISFGRYYHGPTPQVTLPPIADHRFHRCDLVLAQMMDSRAVGPVKERIAVTLQAGGRIWVVGTPYPLAAGQRPLDIAPIDRDPQGQSTPGIYYAMWNEQVTAFLVRHAVRAEALPLPAAEPVAEYEHLSLSVVSGWTLSKDLSE